MSAVLPFHPLVVRQAHVRFIYQGGRLKAVAGPLSAHIAARQAMQFLVNDRSKLLERALIPFAPGPEQDTDVPHTAL